MVQRRVGRKEKMTSASSDTAKRKKETAGPPPEMTWAGLDFGSEAATFFFGLPSRNFSVGACETFLAERTASRNDQDTCSRGGQSYLFTLVNFPGPSSMFPCDRREEGSALGNIDLALIHQHIPCYLGTTCMSNNTLSNPLLRVIVTCGRKFLFKREKTPQSARV